jgi:hypothetical protein
MTKSLLSDIYAKSVILGLGITGGISLVISSLAGFFLAVLDFGQRPALTLPALINILIPLAATTVVYFLTPNILGVYLFGKSLDRFVAAGQIGKRTGMWVGMAIGGLTTGIGVLFFLSIAPASRNPATSLWTMLALLVLSELGFFAWLGWIAGRQSALPDLPISLTVFWKRTIIFGGFALCIFLNGGLLVGRVQGALVERAVHSAMRDYCHEPEDTMFVHPAGLGPLSFLVVPPAIDWQVACIPGQPEPPLVRVNMLTCMISVTIFTGSYSQRISACPTWRLRISGDELSEDLDSGRNYP